METGGAGCETLTPETSNDPGSYAKTAARPLRQVQEKKGVKSQQRGNMKAGCNSAAGKRKDRPAQILAGQLPHAIELLLHVFSSAAPPGRLGGKVNGASVRKRSATSRPSRPKETREKQKLTNDSRNFNAVHQVLQKQQKAEKRLLELHRSPRQTLFAERAQPVWEEGGSALTSLLDAALTCDSSAQKTAAQAHILATTAVAFLDLMVENFLLLPQPFVI